MNPNAGSTVFKIGRLEIERLLLLTFGCFTSAKEINEAGGMLNVVMIVTNEQMQIKMRFCPWRR